MAKLRGPIYRRLFAKSLDFCMKWTHDALMNDLADHLRKPERMVWCDLQMGPSGSPRPDVFTIAKSYSNPMALCYEIKISISDFRSDTTSNKWRNYLQFAAGVFFAVPEGLITKADLPENAGLIVRSENGWRVLKKPTLGPVLFPQAMMLKLLIDGIERATSIRNVLRFSEWQVNEKIAKKFGRKVAALIYSIVSAERELERLQGHIEAERQARQVESAEHRATLTQRFAAERAKIDNEFANIAIELGLPPESSAFLIIKQLKKLVRASSADNRVATAVEFMKSAQRLLSEFNSEINPADIPAQPINKPWSNHE